jgi:hypothetical protein
VPFPEIFSHFTIALKAWLKSWLAIPVCSYFYMPQPAYIQLVHGAMMLTRWIRVAGPSAVKLSNTGAAVVPPECIPALSGVPSCPDLSLPMSPASPAQNSAQILSLLRANVTAQEELRIDVLSILDTMAARFEAAKEEITAAQGLGWENDTWDLAADHLRMKKARIEKWCEVTAVGEGRSPLADAHNDSYEGSRAVVNMLPARSVYDLGWVTPDYDWNTIQWESAMFDEFLQDIHM